MSRTFNGTSFLSYDWQMAMRVTKFCSQMSRCPTAADGRFGVPPLVEVFNPNGAMMQNLHQDLNRNMLDIYVILSLIFCIKNGQSAIQCPHLPIHSSPALPHVKVAWQSLWPLSVLQSCKVKLSLTNQCNSY